MLFFLLPLLFNPFNLIANWLPGLYLAAWPILIQTLGRETLITHALVLIIFIVTCDVSREIMLNLIGLDLFSFPLGLALLAFLTTSDKGSLGLSLIKPLFSGLLVVSEPIFLLIETYLVLDMVKSFNKWISKRANVRDEDSHDLSSWDPPLTRGAILARIFVILMTSLSYFGVYLIIQESKSLLGSSEDTPANFNHAIAALVTLQLIAFSATIYKEEGILSESAIVALLASIPIFIASWSYYHLMENAQSSSRSWTSYFPFSTLDTSGASSYLASPNLAESHLASYYLDGSNLLSSYLASSGLLNAEFGLSLDKLAKYYFGPDFWYILGGRLACLSWWALRSFQRRNAAAFDSSSQNQNNSNASHRFRSTTGGDQHDGSLLEGAESRWLALTSWLPITKRTFVKVLLVLAYAQMLIQQMDNRHHFQDQAGLLAASEFPSSSLDDYHLEGVAAASGSCCAGSHLEEPQQANSAGDEDVSWLSCMWNSAIACSQHKDLHPCRLDRLFDSLKGSLGRLLTWTLDLPSFLYKWLLELFGFLQVAHVLWFARWRSPIIQRLGQSMLLQLCYIGTLVFDNVATGADISADM